MGPEKGELSGRENDGQCKLKVRWSRQCQQYTESLVYCESSILYSVEDRSDAHGVHQAGGRRPVLFPWESVYQC